MNVYLNTISDCALDTGESNEDVKGESNKTDPAKMVVKSGQIENPDRLFLALFEFLYDKYMEIGIELGLPSEVLKNELETGEFKMRKGSEKAMKMLQLWRNSVSEDNFTYSVLAAALEKHGLQRYAHKYCYNKGNQSELSHTWQMLV